MTHEEMREEERELIASGVMTPPEREMDWEAFWAMPRANVSDEVVREAVAWAKGDAAMEACYLSFFRPKSVRIRRGLAL